MSNSNQNSEVIYIISDDETTSDILAESFQQPTQTIDLSSMDKATNSFCIAEIYSLSDNLDDANEFIQDVIDNSGYLLLIPRINSSNELEKLFDDENFKIDTQSTSKKILVNRRLRGYIDFEDGKILTAGSIARYRGQELVTDEEKNTVLIDYQPSSKSGGFFLTTIELGSYSFQTNQQKRKKILQALYQYYRKEKRQDEDLETSQEEDDSIVSLSEVLIDRTLLGLKILVVNQNDSVSADLIESKLPDNMSYNPSEEEWEALLEYLEQRNVLNPKDLSIDEKPLNQVLRERKLMSFVRRIENG